MAANIIWSGNSASAGSRSGPGTGVSYTGINSGGSTPRTQEVVGRLPVFTGASLPDYLSQMQGIAQGNNLIGQNANFNSYDDVFKTISSILQNTFSGSSQAVNNKAYRQLLEEQNEYNTNSANKAMKFSREMVERQMQFQQYNADTSYQRAVKDLKAAGLNPVLAAFNGGSPSPSGGSAQGVAAHSSQVAGYDEGYNGITQIASSLISNLPMLTVASALNGSRGMKNLISTMTSLVDNVANFVDNFINPKPSSKRSSKQAKIDAANGKGGKTSLTGG